MPGLRGPEWFREPIRKERGSRQTVHGAWPTEIKEGHKAKNAIGLRLEAKNSDPTNQLLSPEYNMPEGVHEAQNFNK